MNHFLTVALLLGASLFLTNCKKDDNSSNLTGTAQFEVTDGPVDDANVKGTFVTVTAIKVDGQAISGFSKQTIDLMAYQQGNTKLLGSAKLEAGSYNQVTLVLDYLADEDGNSPGCYVLGTDNVKHNLQASSSATNELTISNGNFEVTENGTTSVVLDFDLRKAVRYEDAPQAGDQYDFVSEAELRTAIRFVAKANTGKVTGTCADNLGFGGDKIVVYAYEKGSFDKETEMQAQGESQLLFKNAVTSSAVNGQGEYTLAFLEEGDYELHFIGYEDKDNDGQLEAKGELRVSLLTNLGLDLANLGLDANANVSIAVQVIGIIP